MIQKGLIHQLGIILLIEVFLPSAFGPVLDFSHAPRALAETPAPQNTAQAEEQLLQGLAHVAPKGWTLKEDAKIFTAKNLWEQIDGRAEFFLAYDMVKMVFAHYTEASKDGNYIDVSIYDMGNPANAFGVFAAERREGFSPVDLGRRGYRLGSHVFIWQGAYYVRMIASDDGPGLRKTNLNAAKDLIPLLKDQGEPLEGLQTLPAEDRIPGSEQYFRRDALGLDFLADTYTARYRKKDVVVTVFLSKKAHAGAAEDILRRYAAYAELLGEGVREVARSGVSILLCDMDGSFDAVFQKGDTVGGVTAVEDLSDAVEFARDLWQRLPHPAPGNSE